MHVVVFAEPPLPGRCLGPLLAAHEPAWTAGLHAAMLRDTLDGLQALTAARTFHVVTDADAEGVDALARHVPPPWEVARAAPEGAGVHVYARSDAPSAPIEPLMEALAERPARGVVLGSWVFAGPREVLADAPWGTPELAALLRVRCTRLGLPIATLPPALVVAGPSDVLALSDELRRHPERAPRTAQFLVTRG